MAQLEVINVGATANDGTGDPLRVAFEKVNNNFASLWASNFNSLEAITIGNTAGQLIFTVPVTAFTQATFQINSSDQANARSQNIVINAAINNAKTAVKWTGHSSLFYGNPVTGYDMDVAAGNVNLYANPLTTAQLVHWIVYQVTDDPMIAGSILVTNQNVLNSISTENSQAITTEN